MDAFDIWDGRQYERVWRWSRWRYEWGFWELNTKSYKWKWKWCGSYIRKRVK